MSPASSAPPLSVQDVTRHDRGVLVTFSNGTLVLYHANFLYDVRDHDGNIEYVEPSDLSAL